MPYVSPAMVKLTVDELRSTGLVNKIYLLASDSLQAEACDGCEILQVDTLTGTNTLRTIWEHADERNVLFYTGTTPLRFGQNGLERMLLSLKTDVVKSFMPIIIKYVTVFGRNTR